MFKIYFRPFWVILVKKTLGGINGGGGPNTFRRFLYLENWHFKGEKHILSKSTQIVQLRSRSGPRSGPGLVPGPRSGPKGPRTKDQRAGPGLTLNHSKPLLYDFQPCPIALSIHEDIQDDIQDVIQDDIQDDTQDDI